MVNTRQLLLTKDGSHTVEVPSLNITYRSRHGALQESSLVFIDAGLKYKWSADPCWSDDPQKVMQIFELGFGTGLNALLTAEEAMALGLKISYTTIEPAPLEPAITGLLNYNDTAGYLRKMHEAEWGIPVNIHPYFRFTKYKSTLEDFEPNVMGIAEVEPFAIFDLVYFDAFGPLTQPALWSAKSFIKVASFMKRGAVLTTYCSKSVVRKTMTECGLKVEKIPGPYGKREMVRATK